MATEWRNGNGRMAREWWKPGIMMTDDVCNIGSGINELKNLSFLPRASESREVMVEDRTRAHADHVGYGFDRSTTAAVGILKAVHSPEEQ